MVSLSTTCFGRLESVESCTALLCDCGGTRSRSCGAASSQPVTQRAPSQQGRKRGSKAIGVAVRLGSRGREALRRKGQRTRTSSISELIRSRRCFSTVLWLTWLFDSAAASGAHDSPHATSNPAPHFAVL